MEVGSCDLKHIAVISVAVIGLTVSMLAQEPERRGFWPKLGGEFTPTASDELAKGPVPRMPDGRPDPRDTGRALR